MALLVPTQPSPDLIELLRAHGVSVIWPTDGDFTRVHA